MSARAALPASSSTTTNTPYRETMERLYARRDGSGNWHHPGALLESIHQKNQIAHAAAAISSRPPMFASRLQVVSFDAPVGAAGRGSALGLDAPSTSIATTRQFSR